MFDIIEEIPFNLLALMLQQISEAASRSRASLSYGMVLTILFREKGVHLEDEELRNLLHSNTVNVHYLHCISYKKMNGQRTRRRIERGKARDDEASPSKLAMPIEYTEEIKIARSVDSSPNQLQIGSSAQTPHPSYIRLDTDQLQYVMKQVITGLQATRFFRQGESSKATSQGSISASSGLTLHMDTLCRLIIDLHYEITDIHISHVLQSVRDLETELRAI